MSRVEITRYQSMKALLKFHIFKSCRFPARRCQGFLWK